jgi:hypothetical protein
LYIQIFPDFILHVSAFLGHHQIYHLNTKKNMRRRDTGKHKTSAVTEDI